jgi:2,5-furandicarboxylate decarboxylase 1
MGANLQAFLTVAEGAGLLHRIRRMVDPREELGALCAQSDRPILFERLLGYPGWRAVDCLARNRTLQGLALRVKPEAVVSEVARRLADPIGPTPLVNRAAWQAEGWEGEAANLARLPVATHSERDGAQYIGGALGIVKDPETGVQNVFMPRTMVRPGKRRYPFYLYSSHTRRIMKKYSERGEPMPMALALGHHPAVEIGANFHGKHPTFSELNVAAALLREPLPLVRCPTVDLLVPADAEIVVEGLVPIKVREEEGPFGDVHDHYFPGVSMQPVFDVLRVTMRRDAIYRHINATNATDHQALSEVTHAAQIYARLEAAGVRVVDVHMPSWAGLFLTVVQLASTAKGEGLEALRSLLAMPFIHKFLVAVDTDVNIYDVEELFWAVATRADPRTDVVTLPGPRKSPLDPSPSPEPPHACLIDATIPGGLAYREDFRRARPRGHGRVWLRDFLESNVNQLQGRWR